VPSEVAALCEIMLEFRTTLQISMGRGCALLFFSVGLVVGSPLLAQDNSATHCLHTYCASQVQACSDPTASDCADALDCIGHCTDSRSAWKCIKKHIDPTKGDSSQQMTALASCGGVHKCWNSNNVKPARDASVVAEKSCFFNTSVADPLRTSLNPFSPCGDPESCGYLCIAASGQPGTLNNTTGSWACNSAAGLERPGTYRVLVQNVVDAMCGRGYALLSWYDSTPQLPIGVQHVLSAPNGNPICKHGNSVGTFGWNQSTGRWECVVVGSDGKQQTLLIPSGLQVLLDLPFDPPV